MKIIHNLTSLFIFALLFWNNVMLFASVSESEVNDPAIEWNIDPSVLEEFRLFISQFHTDEEPNFKDALVGYTRPRIIPHYPYPLIIIPAGKEWFQAGNLKSLFPVWREVYIRTSKFCLPEEEREHYLALIKDLAPKLYDEFMLLGDKIFMHFIKSEKDPFCSISVNKVDGLPIFGIGFLTNHLTEDLQKFALGHELGHYALEHLQKQTPLYPFLKEKEDKTTESQDEQPNKFLPFEETFENARKRINEYEADKFAVLNLGISPIHGIRLLFLLWEKSKLKKDVARKTFLSTHPSESARIKHLNSLKDQQARSTMLKEPNWKELADLYKLKAIKK